MLLSLIRHPSIKVCLHGNVSQSWPFGLCLELYLPTVIRKLEQETLTSILSSSAGPSDHTNVHHSQRIKNKKFQNLPQTPTSTQLLEAIPHCLISPPPASPFASIKET